MEEIYNKWQLQDKDLGSTEPYQFTKSELLDFAKYYSEKSLEIAKIEATKRIKSVVELSLYEYTTALSNGRCSNCSEPLVEGEGITCEDCLHIQ